jgi:tetratricopeptide (TPR) repeat protein
VSRLPVAGLALTVALGLLRGAARADGGERGTLEHLEQRSRSFYDLLEHGERQQASAAWPGLEADLGTFAGRLREQLDRMREDVMDRDGDLEELYRSPRWREPEIASLVATYHLAWVRYQGAQLVSDAARKKTLLRQAVEGFSQFLVVNEVPEIYAESLYGRGLAFLDLGETAKAMADLAAAAEEPRVGAKARAALEEARRRGTGKQAPAETDPETLLTRLGDLLPRAAAGDAGAEKDATALARGLAARGGPWPARVATLVATKLGDGTPGSVHTSYGLFLLGQLAVDRGHCEEAAPLAAAGAGVRDAGRPRHRPELLFLAGGCLLNARRAADAAAQLGALLGEFPDSPRAPEAAYYRLRALDVARTSDATLTASYEEALTGYLARYPQADHAGEVRYLLAELHRGRGDCARAGAEYAAVTSGPFAVRARLGALECQVAALGTDTSPAGQARRRDTAAALGTFVHDTPAKGDDQPRVARAALLGALVAAGATPPDYDTVVTLLDGFEAHYPDARELHARALQLRLNARIARGAWAAAEPDLNALLAGGGGDAERRRVLGRIGHDLAAQAERDGSPPATGALALACKVYGALAEESGDPRDRIVLAELTLRAGDAPAARRLYDAALAADPASSEARRGAARAAAAAGDRAAALAQWRTVLEASPPGGTAWYEARIAQVTLLAGDGRRAEACQVSRAGRTRPASAGAEQLAARLDQLAAGVCQ